MSEASTTRAANQFGALTSIECLHLGTSAGSTVAGSAAASAGRDAATAGAGSETTPTLSATAPARVATDARHAPGTPENDTKERHREPARSVTARTSAHRKPKPTLPAGSPRLVLDKLTTSEGARI